MKYIPNNIEPNSTVNRRKQVRWSNFFIQSIVLKNFFIILFFAGMLACSERNIPDCSGIEERKYLFTTDEINTYHFLTEKVAVTVLSEIAHIQGESVFIPESHIVVSPKVPGFIHEIKVQPGNEVRKGQLLAILQHIDYLELKIQYLEAKNDFEFYKKNYARQGELAIEQATSLKKMEYAELMYHQAELKYLGLKEKIKLIGIDADDLSPNSLNDLSFLYAPASGKIQSINAFMGQYCSNNSVVVKINSGNQHFFQFRLNKEIGDNLLSPDSVHISIDGKNSELYKAYTIVENDNGWLVRFRTGSDNIKKSFEQISGEFIYKKKVFKLPAKALINDSFIFVLHNKKDIIIKKVETIQKEQKDVFITFFQLKENYEIVTGNYETFLNEICQ